MLEQYIYKLIRFSCSLVLLLFIFIIYFIIYYYIVLNKKYIYILFYILLFIIIIVSNDKLSRSNFLFVTSTVDDTRYVSNEETEPSMHFSIM